MFRETDSTATLGSIVFIAMITFYTLIKVQSGNYSELSEDVQARIYSRLNVMDRMNVRKIDKKRNEIVKKVHNADITNLKEMKMLLEFNITNKNIHRSLYLGRVESLAHHLKHTLPYYQTISSNLRIIKNHEKLSRRNIQLLMDTINISSTKCMFCQEQSSGFLYDNHYDKSCNYCPGCWQQWIQNRTGNVRCPICLSRVYPLTSPFEMFSLQPGYSHIAESEIAESDTSTWCGRAQERADIREGCIGHFICENCYFLEWLWFGQLFEGFDGGIGDYTGCCLRVIAGVPVTCFTLGCGCATLSMTGCCCADCCYVCFPQKNWRSDAMLCCARILTTVDITDVLL